MSQPQNSSHTLGTSSQVQKGATGNVNAMGAAAARDVITGATTDDAYESSTQTFSKNVAVIIKGSLGSFSIMGPGAATWKPLEGKHVSIFGIDDSAPPSLLESQMQSMSINSGAPGAQISADLGATTNALRNVHIKKATLLQCHNTFPVPLGVTVSCLPRNEVVDTGDKYTFTTIPNTGINAPSILFEAGESHAQAAEWQKLYARFNAGNLETQDVMKVPGQSLLFVHESHPVIHLLRTNKNFLGVDIDQTRKFDDHWYKITQPLMEAACDTLRTKILSKMSTQNLMDFEVQLHRVGDVEWSQVDNSDIHTTFAARPEWDAATTKNMLAKHEKEFVDRPSTFMARINIEYEIQR